MREFGLVMLQSRLVMLTSEPITHFFHKKHPAINLRGDQFPYHTVS
jgi:hypothetical protein